MVSCPRPKGQILGSRIGAEVAGPALSLTFHTLTSEIGLSIMGSTNKANHRLQGLWHTVITDIRMKMKVLPLFSSPKFVQ